MDERRRNAAIALLVLLVGADTALGLILPSPRLSGRGGPSYALAQRLRTRFNRTMVTYAERLASGAITVDEWRIAMGEEVAVHTTAMSMAGNADATLTAAQVERITEVLKTQGAYLDRFAATITERLGQEAPLSQAAIAARSTLYGGPAYGEYWQAAEGRHGDALGYVVYYRAVDDRRTCAACINAEQGGPYLVGDGPMPGDVCYGGGRCRCYREMVYEPSEYARLAGERGDA